jgi:hypothetical protein
MLEKLLPYIMPKSVTPMEVEGACYSITDFREKSVVEWNLTEPELIDWRTEKKE